MKHLIKTMAFTLLGLVLSSNVMAAITSPWSCTFASPDAISSNSITKNNVTWTVATTSGKGSPAISAANSNKKYGLKFGSSKDHYYGTVTFSTEAFKDYNVTAVTINILNNGSKAGTLSIKQGDVTIGSTSATFGQAWTDLTVNNETTSYKKGQGGTLYFTYSVEQAFFINTITVTFEEASSKTLTAVTVSGTPTKTTYEAGEEFDPAGLTVTGTYSEGEPETITSGITWSYETTDVLEEGQTSIKVKATVDEVTSANWYTVSGLTVNAHQVTPGTYDIVPNNTFWEKPTQSGSVSISKNTAFGPETQNDITLSMNSGNSTNSYMNDNHSRAYNGYTLTISVPNGFLLTAIEFTGSTWDANSPTANVGTVDSKDNKKWTGSLSSVTFSFSGTCYLSNIKVTYIQDIKSAITFSNPANGTLTIKNGDATLSSGAEVSQGTVLDVAATRTSDAYRLKEIKIVKTEGSDDVTSDVYDATTGKLTMPAYAITVSATMEDNNYLVTFHSNTTPAQEDKTQTFTYTKAANLTANAFTAPTGYEFFKWATTTQGEGTIADGAEYTLASEANADLYAKWVAKTIEVTLKANGSGTDGVALVDYDATAVGDIDHVAAWAEHELLGYYTAATEGSKILNADGTFAGNIAEWIVDGKWAKTADCELFAQWKAIEKYGISYDLTGCTANAGNPTEIALADESVTLNFDLAQNYTWDEALISVTMGGNDLPEEDYTFDAGELLIMPTGGFKGNIEAIIYCDFAPATLTLKENGSDRPYGENLKVNSQVTLPNCDVTCDKTFMGWSTSNTDHSNLMAAGTSYTLTSTTNTLYAWFATETPGTEQTVFSENFNACGGTGANDNNGWNGNSIAGKDMPSSITGWTFENAKAAYQCAKFGTSSKKGSAQTPALNCTGDGVLTFKAGAWDANDEVTGLTISATEGVSLKDAEGNAISSVTMTKGAWTTYTVYVYGMETSSKITFAASQASKNRFFLDEVVLKQAGAPSYSDYSLTCSAKANAPVFDLEEGTYTTVQTLTISAEDGATIYYTLDGTEPTTSSTEYTSAISLNTYGKVTIKAIAVVDGKDPSDVTSAVYTMNLPFTSLEQLAAADVQSGTEITISFSKTQIKSLPGTKGVYFYIQKEGKDIEIYAGENRPEGWEAGGYLEATNLTCDWVRYPATGDLTCWELTPSDWSAFTYSAPDPFTSVADLYAAGLTDGSKVYLNITNAYVHGKTFTTPNNFVYVQDGGVGIVLRTSETIDDENIGKLMTAKIVGNLAYSNGRPQIAVSSLSEVSYSAGSRPTANSTTLSASEEATQILSLVKFDGFYAQSQDKTAKTAVITENADGTGARYTIYNLFNALKTVPESDKAINVKGLFYKKVENNVTSYSIVPVLVEDVALVTPADAPAASVDKGSEDSGNPTEVGNGEIITITPAAGFTASYILNDAAEKTITATEEKVTMIANSTLIIKSSRDYYTTTSKTYYYVINEALTYHSITKPLGNYTCELSAASAKQGDHVTITFTMNDHWYLDGVTVKNAADEAETFAATKESDNVYGFDMPAYDVKLSTSTHGDPKYSITYQKGGIQAQGEDITEVAQYEGTVLTLKECTWTSDNYVFKGWKAQYNDGENDVELEIVDNKITVPAYDVKIIAQWNKIASYDWVLVTDADQLAAGDYVVIASNAKGKVASNTITNQYMEEKDATFSTDKTYLNSVPTGAAILTLGGEADAWTLTNKDGGVLGATAEKKLAWDGQNATNTWTISVDANTYAATIQNTHKTNNSYDYGRFLHNVNSTRFTTYTSAANNTMLLPQLYKAVEHTYVVKYHLNGGANKPADSHADADGKVTITTDVPTYTAHKFLGWNAEQDGSGQAYVGGQEYTIEDDITIYAQWQEVSKYTVTYIANGATGSVPTETDKYEASKFSVKGQGELEYPDYIFRGWSDGENIYQEGDEYTMPNHAVEFTAQWVDANISNWHLVTNTKMLRVGDQVIIAAADYDYAMGAHSSTNLYRDPIAINKKVDDEHFNDGKLLVGQTSPVVLTLKEGSVEGTFALYDGSKYIVPASSSSNKMDKADDVSDAASWAITIDPEGATTIVSQAENIAYNYIKYNAGSGQERFSCYGENSCTEVAIYKYIEGVKTVREVSADTYTTWCIPQGVEVGNFYGATFWNIADKAYMEDGVRLYSITIEQEEGNLGAGVPYIMLPDAETTEFVYYATGDEEVAGTNNGLVGVFEDTPFDPVTDEEAAIARGIYVISNGTLYLCGNNCGVYANRAYIERDQINPLPQSGAPRRVIGNPNGTPTTLNGIFGNQSIKAQKALIDGHIYILRDNKMYNAQGLFVK